MLVLILAKRLVGKSGVTEDVLFRRLDRKSAERAFFVIKRRGIVHRSSVSQSVWFVKQDRLRQFIEEQEKSNADE